MKELRKQRGDVKIITDYIRPQETFTIQSLIDETQAMFLFQKIALNYVCARELAMQIFAGGKTLKKTPVEYIIDYVQNYKQKTTRH